DLVVTAMFHDGLHVRGERDPTAAVDLDPDFHAHVGRRFPALDQRFPNLLERLGDLYPRRYSVGPHLHTLAAQFRCELDKFLARLDVLANDCGIRRVKLAHRPAAPEGDAGVGEALLHVLALFSGQAWLDPVLVRRATLDCGQPDRLADF